MYEVFQKGKKEVYYIRQNNIKVAIVYGRAIALSICNFLNKKNK